MKEGEIMNSSGNIVIPIIKLLSEIIEKKVNYELKDYDITIGQARVLALLKVSENEEMALKEIESFFHTAQSTVAGVVSRLEEKELVMPCSDSNDRRIKKIRLTQKGKDLINRSANKIGDIEMTLTKGFEESERKELIRLLFRVYDNIK